jgi:S1-C subfamily serine protease
MIGFGQHLNNYKYIIMKSCNSSMVLQNDERVCLKVSEGLRKANFTVINYEDIDNYKDLIEIPELGINCYVTASEDFSAMRLKLILKDVDENEIAESYGAGMFFSTALNKLLKPFMNLSYEFDSTYLGVNGPKILTVNNDTIDISSEISIRNYFEDNGSEGIEGIWEVAGESNYRLTIIKDDYKFKAYNLDRNKLFLPGDYKASFEEASSEGVFTINWLMGNKETSKKTVGISKSSSLIEFSLDKSQMIMYKVYPKSNNKRSKKTGEWAGNGSGIIISKSGYIITNHHVIDDADDIEVEFILDDEVQKFNAEIVQSDKVNDLAVIKIVDVNFDGVKELPYNFKTRSSDVGTKVYAFGYPMALSIMGKEIKVTDGIISSKTGFEGDITTYQISAPIQGGNSGGPLFDDKGNFIGINSSGINKKLADNVGYSIKTSYVLNLIDILPKAIDLPSNKKLESLPLTEQIKEISKYVVLIKVK